MNFKNEGCHAYGEVIIKIFFCFMIQTASPCQVIILLDLELNIYDKIKDLILRFAISGPPTNKGNRKLPNPPIKAGIRFTLTFINVWTISLPVNIVNLLRYFTCSL